MGIYIEGQNTQLRSNTITTDNLVNGKPLYYFEGCSGTSINGVPVGQLIVVNCTNFQASNLRIDSVVRSEEHTSELQSLTNIVCRLLLEKKKVNEVYSS